MKLGWIGVSEVWQWNREMRLSTQDSSKWLDGRMDGLEVMVGEKLAKNKKKVLACLPSNSAVLQITHENPMQLLAPLIPILHIRDLRTKVTLPSPPLPDYVYELPNTLTFPLSVNKIIPLALSLWVDYHLSFPSLIPGNEYMVSSDFLKWYYEEE